MAKLFSVWRTKIAAEILKSIDFSDTQNARQPNDTSPNNTDHSEKRIYLPNIHTKLLKCLLSSPDHRQNLMKDMARKRFDIVWPQTEEGIRVLRFFLTTSTFKVTNSKT